jgi:hypothetical protein
MVHLERRADGATRHLNCLGANLLSCSWNASGTHMLGEGSQLFDSLRWSSATNFCVNLGEIEGEEIATSRPKTPFFAAKGDGALNILEEIIHKSLL